MSPRNSESKYILQNHPAIDENHTFILAESGISTPVIGTCERVDTSGIEKAEIQ